MIIFHVCGRQDKQYAEFHIEVDPDLVIENLPNCKGRSSTGAANEATCWTFFQGHLEQARFTLVKSEIDEGSLQPQCVCGCVLAPGIP